MADAEANFGTAWKVLERLAAEPDAQRRQAALRVLTAGQLDWGDLLDHALRHRMLPLLAHEMLALGTGVPAPMRVAEHLRSVLNLNRYRRGIWYGEAARVCAALTEAGVPVAARKGAAFEADVYHGNGSRWLGDIDLLIDAADRDTSCEVMAGLGYQQGLYDPDRDLVVPFGRAEMIRYKLNPDHLPTHSLITGDPLVPVVEVDFTNSLTWARSQWQIPVGPVLATVEHIRVEPAVVLPRPAVAYLFLDTVLHLFREAWFEWWLDKEQDVDLMKFGDVIRLWHLHRDRLADGTLLRLVEQHRIVEPVCWVLAHLDRTFDTDICAAVGLTDRVSETFLHSAGAANGSSRHWTGTMRQRLFTRERRGLFEASPAAVGAGHIEDNRGGR